MLEQKYISFVGSQLAKFNKVATNTWNFRCPLCGDSQKNKNKKRAYIYAPDGISFRFHCHNCEATMTFEKFLYEFDDALYQEYKKEYFKERISPNNSLRKTQETHNDTLITTKDDSLICVSELLNTHPGKKYLIDRGVDIKQNKNIYWTDDFVGVVKSAFPDKYEFINKVKESLPGLVFSVFDFDTKKLIGYQFRTTNTNVNKSYRFINCFDRSLSKSVFNPNIDVNSPHYVVEGVIDSLFLDNSVAVLNSALSRINLPKGIYIHDCEPRNAAVCKQINKTIEKGFSVVLLPEEYSGMDINDIIIKHNINKNKLIDIIQANTYVGLTARVKFAQWKKTN